MCHSHPLTPFITIVTPRFVITSYRDYYGCKMAGFSIPAAEHRCVCVCVCVCAFEIDWPYLYTVPSRAGLEKEKWLPIGTCLKRLVSYSKGMLYSSFPVNVVQCRVFIYYTLFMVKYTATYLAHTCRVHFPSFPTVSRWGGGMCQR